MTTVTMVASQVTMTTHPRAPSAVDAPCGRPPGASTASMSTESTDVWRRTRDRTDTDLQMLRGDRPESITSPPLQRYGALAPAAVNHRQGAVATGAPRPGCANGRPVTHAQHVPGVTELGNEAPQDSRRERVVRATVVVGNPRRRSRGNQLVDLAPDMARA